MYLSIPLRMKHEYYITTGRTVLAFNSFEDETLQPLLLRQITTFIFQFLWGWNWLLGAFASVSD